ncbi:hypothetical protein MHYP_G00336800 [Metynnis hypsauchen]
MVRGSSFAHHEIRPHLFAPSCFYSGAVTSLPSSVTPLISASSRALHALQKERELLIALLRGEALSSIL